MAKPGSFNFLLDGKMKLMLVIQDYWMLIFLGISD